MGAYLSVDSCVYEQAGVVGPEIIDSFKVRIQQIQPLEGLALLAAIWSNRDRLRGRTILIFVDNLPMVYCVVKGCAAHVDVCSIAGATQALLAQLKCRWWIEWVASDDNPADRPSRVVMQRPGAYPLLELPRWCKRGFNLAALASLLEGRQIE